MFKAKFPNNIEDLHLCFDRLERSAYYDGSLTRSQVVRTWEELLIEGSCLSLLGEYTSRKRKDGLQDEANNGSILLFSIVAYVTRGYAEYIVRNPQIRQVGMDFLDRCYRYHFAKSGSNPAMTRAEIETNQEGLYFLNFTNIIDPSLLSDLPLSAKTVEITAWLRDMSIRSFGGYNHNVVFNDVRGDFVKNCYLGTGHQLLRGHADNEQLPKERRAYLLCRTPNKIVSRQIGIPEHLNVHVEIGNWFWSVFEVRKSDIKLSDLQKRIGTLLVLGYSKERIAELYPRITGDAPVASDSRENMKRVSDNFHEIGTKLKDAGYLSGTITPAKIERALLSKIHEIRPVVVPLYPDMSP